jgi:hypothetical protein
MVLAVNGAVAAEKAWDQAGAKKMVAKVLEVEKAKNRPWNGIAWRKLTSSAVDEAKKTGMPIFVFFFVEQDGPPLERCDLEGRLIRTHVLSNPTVAAHIKASFIPVKLKLETGKDFPVDWPALKKTATAFAFSNAKGFAGCSIVSPDLEIEYGNSGSAKMCELFDSTAYSAKEFAGMLERASSRVMEERSLRVQRGISDFERKLEVHRFRRGVTLAVRSEGVSHLPPKGYSLERALELYQMAGAVEVAAEAK